MLNNFILVGRVTETPTTHTLTLAVTRTYKNIEGVYDTDFIEVQLPQQIQENAAYYLSKGDLVGVKGRIETTTTTDHNTIKLMADRLTYLSQSTNHNTTDNATTTDNTTTNDTTTDNNDMNTDNNMNKGEI